MPIENYVHENYAHENHAHEKVSRVNEVTDSEPQSRTRTTWFKWE